VVLVTILATMSACGSTDAGSGEPFPLPTYEPAEVGMMAQISGVLEADAENKCVWLRVPEPYDDTGDTKLSIVWPAGYTARTDPIRIYGADGELVATEGDEILMGGGIGSAGDRCRVGSSTWVVYGTVESK
jgi:hypothetical protein